MRHHDTRHPPAIVFGKGYTGLGALRSLVLAGIPAYVACPERDLATHSRWYRPTPGAEACRGVVGPRANAALEAISLQEAVLIPGADDAALWMSDLPGSPLGDRFHVSSSSRETLETLQDKSRFGAFLSRSGIAHPRTFSIDGPADVEAIPFHELDRVFIKPADSQQFSRALGVKGIWAGNQRDFREIWNRMDASGLKVIAQEYVPGSASDHYFIDGFRDRNGILAGLFARRRTRIFPPDFGNSSYCRSTPLSEVAGALASLTALLSALRYRGIFSAEFKRDARNGEFKILEVNTRAWWYVEFAARCGVNVCRMAYEDAREQPVAVASTDYPSGVGCVSLADDIRSHFSQSPSQRSPLRKTLNEWARAHYHVFRPEDPAPGLWIAWQNVSRLLMKAARRVGTAIVRTGGRVAKARQPES